MSPRKNESDAPEASKMNDTPDAEDTRAFEHDDAEEVRQGNLSAAQMSGGGGNVDASEPDAQYPPGRIDNAAPSSAPEDLSTFVPDKRNARAEMTYETTAEAPFGSGI